MKLDVYTDGSAVYGDDRKSTYGGWGAVVLHDNMQIEMIGNDDYPTTSNRMELLAVIHSLRAMKRGFPVNVYTDSMYVITCFRCAKKWEANDFRIIRTNKPVKNMDLLKLLLKCLSGRGVNFNHVKAHSGLKWNDRADALAAKARNYAAEEKWIKRHTHSIALV